MILFSLILPLDNLSKKNTSCKISLIAWVVCWMPHFPTRRYCSGWVPVDPSIFLTVPQWSLAAMLRAFLSSICSHYQSISSWAPLAQSFLVRKRKEQFIWEEINRNLARNRVKKLLTTEAQVRVSMRRERRQENWEFYLLNTFLGID